MTAGRKLARWRATRGLSQRAAAALAGISQPAWLAIEKDRMKRIGADIARAIVEATKGAVSYDDLTRRPKKRRPSHSTPPRAGKAA